MLSSLDRPLALYKTILTVQEGGVVPEERGVLMIIQEIQLFQGVPSHMMDEIAQLATEEPHVKGKEVCKEGSAADFLYILEEGELELLVQGKGGVAFLLDKPGLVFGWSALIEPRRYTATARFLKDSKVVKIDGDRLMRILENHPEEGLKVMRRLSSVIASRLMKSYEELALARKKVPSD
jgi:CRP-like cAMP-binding protein